mmetsp:Transcript_18756/g.27931  ORF Transcript_18756/g.27931 Transcript_18756/m.27931 type:complete len:246 (+) Transcript_18756:503-1240(+)
MVALVLLQVHWDQLTVLPLSLLMLRNLKCATLPMTNLWMPTPPKLLHCSKVVSISCWLRPLLTHSMHVQLSLVLNKCFDKVSILVVLCLFQAPSLVKMVVHYLVKHPNQCMSVWNMPIQPHLVSTVPLVPKKCVLTLNILPQVLSLLVLPPFFIQMQVYPMNLVCTTKHHKKWLKSSNTGRALVISTLSVVVVDQDLPTLRKSTKLCANTNHARLVSRVVVVAAHWMQPHGQSLVPNSCLSTAMS